MSIENAEKILLPKNRGSLKSSQIVEAVHEEEKTTGERKNKDPCSDESPKIRHDAQKIVEKMGKNGEYCYNLNSIPTSVFSEELLQSVFQEMHRQRKESITRVVLSDMCISDSTVKEICKLDWLKGLFLPYNKLTNSSVVMIAENLVKLESLSFAGNKEIDDIFPCTKMENLKLLWVDETSVALTPQQMVDWVIDSKSLENVDFSATPTDPQGIKLLCHKWQQGLPNPKLRDPIMRSRVDKKTNEDHIIKEKIVDIVKVQKQNERFEVQHSQHDESDSGGSSSSQISTRTLTGDEIFRKEEDPVNLEVPARKNYGVEKQHSPHGDLSIEQLSTQATDNQNYITENNASLSKQSSESNNLHPNMTKTTLLVSPLSLKP